MIQKITSKLIAFALGIILPVAILFLWNWGVKTEVLPPALIASPEKVWNKFKLLVGDDLLLANARISLLRLFAGFVLGSILGIALGVLVGVSKFASKIFEPLILILIPVPPLAWIPLLIIIFGIDEGSKIALLSIGCFCTLFLTTSYSVKSTDKNLLELSKLYSKEWYVKLLRIILPFSASNIVGSLRVAMALSWTLLMASEMIAASAGLGWFIWDSRNFSRADDMIVGMISVGILGWFTDRLLVSLGKYFNRWKAEKKETGLFTDLWIWLWHKLPMKGQRNNLKILYNKIQVSINDFFIDRINSLLGSKHGRSANLGSGTDQPHLEVEVNKKNFKLDGAELRVFTDLSFDINKGDYITLIGPSGCGKSTLLKLIAGLDTVYEGKIKYNNQRITGTSLERCIVFQEQRLLQWLNVNDNIAFALPVSMRRNEKRKKVAEAIELVNLTGFGNVYPSQLSGGMQQRVALARAMVNLPEMLLLDEPYGALDSITRDKMQKELMRIVSKANATVLMVTHDIDEAIIMSDKIFVLGGNPTNIKKAIQIERSKVNEKTAMEFIKIRNQLINELYKN